MKLQGYLKSTRMAAWHFNTFKVNLKLLSEANVSLCGAK